MTSEPTFLQTHRTDLAIGATVAAVGLVETMAYLGLVTYFPSPYEIVAVMLMGIVATSMAVAAGLARPAPGAALGLVWAVGAIHVVAGTRMMLVQLAAAFVAYGAARYGSRTVVWLSGLSIPAGVMLAVLHLQYSGAWPVPAVISRSMPIPGIDSGRLDFLVFSVLATGGVGTAVLAVPWLVGLAGRSSAAARTSRVGEVAAQQDAARAELAREQAEEIATLREGQARLARDVHDVVGHSLAVILAQAESAQFLPADEPERVQETLTNIATTARQSLHDVRDVLATTGTADQQGPRVGELDTLIEGVRNGGNDVRSSIVGRPQPLPPEIEEVAYRVLQEMLTNALKHGRRGEPVHVEQHWEGELRLEVRNVVDRPDQSVEETAPIQVASERPSGRGLEGMRRRLESGGGRLDVRRREEPGLGDTFTATAWVPVRAVR
ncbi:sensor histidine kinase [Nocardioides sp.]|uniref:sensor histidine kinase n=1 Tax=Nocardioides sp. TaxID=35761 RepID=UPI0027350E9A|nr:histidine kinase [Nocardioides sp.]MDP3894096.1 histidine kinase [Nocardioides sp.]